MATLTKAQMLALLADNTTGDISAQDMRDIVTGINTLEDAEANKTTTLDFDIAAGAVVYKEGRLFYRDGTLVLQGAYSDTELNIGEELPIPITNATASTFTNGQVVRFSTTVAGVPAPVLAQADTFDNASNIAVITHEILSGNGGKATTYGLVKGLNTSTFEVNDRLYLSDTVAGGFTATPPDIATFIGFVLVKDAVNGVIFVKPNATISLPTIYGSLGTGTIPTSTLPADVWTTVSSYAKEDNVVIPVSGAGGWIEPPTTGKYRLNVNQVMSYDDVGGTGKKDLLFRIVDVDLISDPAAGVIINDYILKDSVVSKFNLSPLFDATVGIRYVIQLQPVGISLTTFQFSLCEYDITSVHIR